MKMAKISYEAAIDQVCDDELLKIIWLNLYLLACKNKSGL